MRRARAVRASVGAHSNPRGVSPLPQPPIGTLSVELARYRETFQTGTTDSAGNPKYSFDELVLPYFPYFSNCEGYDRYIPIFGACARRVRAWRRA